MKKILTVLGARPQFIKASVVSAAFDKVENITEIVLHTGQHYDANLSEVFFTELGMRVPDHHLDIGGGQHGEMTGRMLMGIEQVLLSEKPDAVLVYGDTNSTLAGALAAAKLHIPVAHVEAGLRAFNRQMPEEINRIVTDRISHWLFTPTDVATKNLRCEGAAESQIIKVGDVMYDVALHQGGKVSAKGGILEILSLSAENYLLATIHRAENTDTADRLMVIIDALISVAETLPVVWPLHPRTRHALARIGQLDRLANKVTLLDPVGYLDMVRLEKFAALIITDSGGVQKEAFFHRVPCVTVRNETEWVELVDAGWNRLAPPLSSEMVTETVLAALGSQGQDIQPYSRGNTAKLIVDVLSKDIPV